MPELSTENVLVQLQTLEWVLSRAEEEGQGAFDVGIWTFFFKIDGSTLSMDPLFNWGAGPISASSSARSLSRPPRTGAAADAAERRRAHTYSAGGGILVDLDQPAALPGRRSLASRWSAGPRRGRVLPVHHRVGWAVHLRDRQQ